MSAAWKGIVGTSFTADEFAEYCDGVTLTDWTPDFIVLHNTQEPRLDAWHSTSGARRMRGLTEYYRDEQGWSGGPHLFIADDRIWAFTPLTVHGVHSPSWNGVAWGVEIVGDFDHEAFGDAQKALVISALASLHRLAGWTEPQLRLHKEDPNTSHDYCPGKNIVKTEIECGVQTLLDEHVP